MELDLYDQAINRVRSFRRLVGDIPFDEPYTRVYLARLLQEQDELYEKYTWAAKHESTLRALIGPHGYTIFKMLRIRSGLDQTRRRDIDIQ